MAKGSFHLGNVTMINILCHNHSTLKNRRQTIGMREKQVLDTAIADVSTFEQVLGHVSHIVNTQKSIYR